MNERKHLSTKEFLERYRQGERTFEQVHISGDASLQGTDLQGIVLRNVMLHEVNLIEANLEGAFLEDTTIEFAQLQRARFPHAIFHKGIIRSSNLEAIHLEGATFQGTVLQEINLQNALLCWAQLHEVDLRQTNIQGADLRGAGFSRTDVRGANLSQVLINYTDTRTMIRDALTRWEPIEVSTSKTRKLMNHRGQVQLSLTGAPALPIQTGNVLSIPGQPDPLPISVARSRVHHMLAERFQRSSRSRQSQFRAALFQAYAKRCAVTGCQVEGTLEAAHIIPFCLSKNCNLWNGILLRSDIHRLFDLNHMRIDPTTATIHFEQSILTIDPSYQAWEGCVVQPPQASLSVSPNPYKRLWKDALVWRRDQYQQLVDGFVV